MADVGRPRPSGPGAVDGRERAAARPAGHHGTTDDRLAPLYELMLATGLRRGEAIGLRWEDVDLERRALVVLQQITEVRGHSVIGTPKTKRGTRLVPIDPATVEVLRRHQATQQTERTAWGQAWQDTGLAFTREDGQLLRPEYATRHFQHLAERLGLPAIRLHDLRHTHASLALAAGVELKVVSDRLGHSQISVTADLYTHVPRDVATAAADQIGLVLRGPDAFPAASLPQDPCGVRPDSPAPLPRARPPPASPQVRGRIEKLDEKRARRDSNP